MTAADNAIAFQPADAPSHEAVTWHAIDWRKANRNVRRLQARIVKAVRAGKWHKVRALQLLLTHSFSGRAMSVKRVTENKGKRTAGTDGEVWSTPKQKRSSVDSDDGSTARCRSISSTRRPCRFARSSEDSSEVS